MENKEGQEEFKTPDSWETVKVSKDIYTHEVSQAIKDKWSLERRQKDGLDTFINQDGFHLKGKGQRSGTIYYIDMGKVCEIFFEMSGVPEFDIIIYFNQVNEWTLPIIIAFSKQEKGNIKEELLNWLGKENIKTKLQ